MCSVEDVEKRLGIALRKLENCVEYLALALSRDGADNPSMLAREKCYSRYGRTLSYLSMLSEFIKILGARASDEKIECYFSLNSLSIWIGGSELRIEEPSSVESHVFVKIQSLSRKGLEIIDMITEAALKTRESLIKVGLLYVLFTLNFESIERGLVTLIRSYGFLDTKYHNEILKNLDPALIGYTIYDLVRVVDLRTGSLIGTDDKKDEKQ